MKPSAKIIAAALMIGGAAIACTAPARADGFGISVGIGDPGWYGDYDYYRPCWWYREYDLPAPYRCYSYFYNIWGPSMYVDGDFLFPDRDDWWRWHDRADYRHWREHDFHWHGGHDAWRGDRHWHGNHDQWHGNNDQWHGNRDHAYDGGRAAWGGEQHGRGGAWAGRGGDWHGNAHAFAHGAVPDHGSAPAWSGHAGGWHGNTQAFAHGGNWSHGGGHGGGDHGGGHGGWNHGGHDRHR